MDEHKVRFSRLELVRQRVFLVYYGKLRANVPFPERDPDHGRTPWPEFARLAAKAGFPGVDVSFDAAMKEGAASTRALLEQLHIRPAVLGFPVEFRKDDATFQKDLEKLDDAARVCQGHPVPAHGDLYPVFERDAETRAARAL